MEAIGVRVPISGWYHWIPNPEKHTFRYQNQVNSIIMSTDNSKPRFQVAAILKSKMADVKRKVQLAQYFRAVGTSCCLPIGWQQLGVAFPPGCCTSKEIEAELLFVDAWLEFELSAE